MRFIVTPCRDHEHPSDWQWELVEPNTGEVIATGREGTPSAARTGAKHFRNSVYMAPIEMGT